MSTSDKSTQQLQPGVAVFIEQRDHELTIRLIGHEFIDGFGATLLHNFQLLLAPPGPRIVQSLVHAARSVDSEYEQP